MHVSKTYVGRSKGRTPQALLVKDGLRPLRWRTKHFKRNRSVMPAKISSGPSWCVQKDRPGNSGHKG